MATYFDTHYPWAGMKRCVVKDNKEVNYYLHADDSTKKINGTLAILDGTDGQVMVEVPAFWYRRFYNGVKMTNMISPYPLAGFEIHPWFLGDNGQTVSYRYFSMCEGSIFDTSANAYLLEDEQVADFTTDKLCSIVGAKLCSGLTQSLTIVNARKLAQNRGVGWQQQYFNGVSAIQMLMSVEYNSFDIQNKLSQGVTNITDDSATNMSVKTGATVSLGNHSGEVEVTHYQTGQKTKVFSYRGIENFYGNLWKFVDGINIMDTYAYITRKNSGFVSDAFDGDYEKAMILPTVNGYVSNLHCDNKYNYVFLPSEVGTNKIGDYYYQNNGVMGKYIARLGARWSDGSGAGAFDWAVNSGSGNRGRNVGSRLML